MAVAESFDQTEGINRKRHASDCSGNHIHLAKPRKKHLVQTARRRMVDHHRKERGKLQHQFGHNSPSFPTVAESGIRRSIDADRMPLCFLCFYSSIISVSEDCHKMEFPQSRRSVVVQIG